MITLTEQTIWWWAAGMCVSAGMLAWCMYADVRCRIERRLAARWVSWAEEWGAWTGAFSFVVSFAALFLYLICSLIGVAIAAGLGDPAWSLLITLPAMLAYAPFAFATAPTEYSQYSNWRTELRSAGADEKTQRRIAWCAGIPSLIGICAMALTLLTVFVFGR